MNERAVNLIPIYDATAPIACSATGDEIAGRVAQLERLRGDLIRLERTDHGMVLHFPNRPDVETEVRSFAVDEKGCCAFWGFDITVNIAELALRWDGPPDVADFFERLTAWFQSDEPLTAGLGLL